MKTKTFLWRAVHMCMVAMMACVINVSCSKEEPIVPEPTPTPTPSSDNGEVSFEISNDSGTGTGTSTSPAEVSKGDTLNMVISQKSKYTDSDGTVFECEPKATIELFAHLDTVYVEDLSQLTNVQETPETQTEAEGKDPVVNKINQKFLIGEQYVNFDLAYEVYDYTTVGGETIEMPYIKLNQANFGNSGATEEAEPNARSETVVKSITVKPLPQTRASISDTTWYEVNAIFNLDIESVNTKSENKQNLTFSVTYLGAVTTEIELSDPVKELSSTLDILGGTSSVASPFLVNPKETLSLLFKQNSSYTDAYGNKMSCEPEARINLFAQQDTVYALTKDEIAKAPSTKDVAFTASGESPILYSAIQSIYAGNQNIQLEMSYETFSATDVENQEIEMPYLKFENVSVGELSINESKTRSVVEADTAFYDVQVPIKLDVVNVGTEDENRQTLEFVVSYVGAVVTEIALSDPIKELSSTIKVLGGTSSTSSPFLAEPGDTLNLLFEQNSSYTDAHGRKISCSPVARLTLFAQQNTIYVQTKDELEGTPTNQELVFKSSGKEPTQYSATQLFKLGAQAMQLELSYEAYTQKDAEDNEIEMPYLKFNSTTASSVSVSEISTSTGTKADTTFYKVQVPIKLETVNVGTAQEDKKVIEIIASYKGAVVTLKDEPELVKVEYRKGYVWEEAHHNLPLLYYAKVYRDRYYSNGEVFTDEFVDNGHPMELTPALVCIGYNDDAFLAEGEYQYSEDDIVIFHKGTMNGEANDSIRTTTSIVEVDDLNAITVKEEFHPSPDGDGYPGKWSCYVTGKTYDDGVYMPVDPGLATSSYESCDLPSGWYFQGFTEKADVTQVFYKDYIASIYSMFMHIRCYDQYLAIDGIRINFLDYLPERVFNTVVENTSYGKKITRETRVKFLGRNFYAACIMEFHQKQ